MANVSSFNVFQTSQTFVLVTNSPGINAGNFAIGTATKGYSYTLNTTETAGTLAVIMNLTARLYRLLEGRHQRKLEPEQQRHHQLDDRLLRPYRHRQRPRVRHGCFLRRHGPGTLNTAFDDSFAIKDLTFLSGTSNVVIGGAKNLTIGSAIGGGSRPASGGRKRLRQ